MSLGIDSKSLSPVVTNSGRQADHQYSKRKWWKFSGQDESHVPVGGSALGSENSSTSDLETLDGKIDVNKTVFADADSAEIYKPPVSYEGAHRFDPNATWTAKEETDLLRRIDWKICLFACITFFALQLDRVNIGQALSDNMLGDLKLTTNDYNNGMSVFYLSFLFAELPSQLISKRLGPDNWIPIQMIAWSIVSCSQAKLSGKTSFFITRWLLGFIEGGFIPDTILYLSYFYKNKELPRRLSYFWGAYILTNIVASLLGAGILRLRGHSGMEGWRWLYALEGGVTALIGIFAWFYMPASPTQTKARGFKGWLRGKDGWFSEREEVIMVTRILRDDPGKSTMHNRQAIDPRSFWASLTDYDLWPIYLIGLSWTVPFIPPVAYLTLNLRALGFTTFHTNLLVIPSSVLFGIQLLFWTWFSERFNQRLFIGLVSQIWAIPLLIALETIPANIPHSAWVHYALSSLIVGYPYAHAVLVALTSRNAGNVRTRTIGSSLYNMAVQAGTVIASQIYRADDKPLYKRGNKILLAIAAYNIVVFVGAKIYYVRRNEQRDKVWYGLTREERVEYLRTTKDEGNKRLDFRFAH